MATFYHQIEVDFEEDSVYVDLTIDASYGNNGIGSYEYWGIPGNDVQMGWEIDDILWNDKVYSERMNQIITEYVNKDSIVDEIYKKIEKVSKDTF